MDVEFYVGDDGEPAIRSGSKVVDVLLPLEKANLPAVAQAIREIEAGQRNEWEGGFDAGGFVLSRDRARLYLDWSDDETELPLREFGRIVRAFLNFKSSRWRKH